MSAGHILKGVAGALITKEMKDEIKEQVISAAVAGAVAASTFLKDDENEDTNKEQEESKDDPLTPDDSSTEETDEEPSTEFQDQENARREKAKAVNEETERAKGISIGDMDKIENADSILEGGNRLEELIDKAKEQKDNSDKTWEERLREEREKANEPDEPPDELSFNDLEDDSTNLQRFFEKEDVYFNSSDNIELAELDQYDSEAFDKFTSYNNYDLKFDLEYQQFRDEYREKEIELADEPDFDLDFSEPTIRMERPDFSDLDPSDTSDSSDGAEGGEGGDGGGDGGSGGSGGAGGGAGGSG